MARDFTKDDPAVAKLADELFGPLSRADHVITLNHEPVPGHVDPAGSDGPEPEPKLAMAASSTQDTGNAALTRHNRRVVAWKDAQDFSGFRADKAAALKNVMLLVGFSADKDTHQATRTTAWLAARSKTLRHGVRPVEDRTLKRHLKTLERLGLFLVEHAKDGFADKSRGTDAVNTYRLVFSQVTVRNVPRSVPVSPIQTHPTSTQTWGDHESAPAVNAVKGQVRARNVPRSVPRSVPVSTGTTSTRIKTLLLEEEARDPDPSLANARADREDLLRVDYEAGMNQDRGSLDNDPASEQEKFKRTPPHGRCAGCGKTGPLAAVSMHVMCCPAFTALYHADPDRAIDPEQEYLRVIEDQYEPSASLDELVPQVPGALAARPARYNQA